MSCSARAAVAILMCALAYPDSGAGQAPPKTEQRPVTDTYGSVTVVDPYRWLEDWTDPAVGAWTDAQNQFTRRLIEGQPFAEAVRRRVKAVGSSSQPRWRSLQVRGELVFAVKSQPPLNQPFLVVLPATLDLAGERAVVDPNRIDPSGRTAIDFYEPSPDGRRVAVSLSIGGTEEGTVHVFDVATGAELPDRIPRVNGGTAGGSVAWVRDGSGFFYTRYPRGAERPAADRDFYQQVYFHALGTPTEADTYAIGREFPRIAEIRLDASPDGRFTLAAVANGDGGEYAHYIAGADGRWRPLTSFSDRVSDVVFGPDGKLFAVTHAGAPHGAIITAPADVPRLADGRVIHRADDGDITQIVVTPSRLVVSQILGGPFELRTFDLLGQRPSGVSLPPVSSVSQLVAIGEDVLFVQERYVEPSAWRRMSRDGQVVETPLASRPAVDFRDIVVTRGEGRSKDGTRVPVTVLHRRGLALDGARPTLLYGYGGYGLSETPRFSATRMVWLEQGGVLAFANIRGGGEFGDAWHRDGHLTNKQNVFDDFAASAEWLVAQRYTSPSTLALEGRSNGGLLMGATLTQRPAMARAVIASVGIYDMLRSELWANGAFNVTEFGSVTDPDQFAALHAYSPYEHVASGTAYPAVLFISATNDPRVNPGDSRRFAARLQAATSSGRPVLLRVSDAGHIGTALSEGLAQTADAYAFLFWQLGVEYRAVGEPPH